MTKFKFNHDSKLLTSALGVDIVEISNKFHNVIQSLPEEKQSSVSYVLEAVGNKLTKLELIVIIHLMRMNEGEVPFLNNDKCSCVACKFEETGELPEDFKFLLEVDYKNPIIVIKNLIKARKMGVPGNLLSAIIKARTTKDYMPDELTNMLKALDIELHE